MNADGDKIASAARAVAHESVSACKNLHGDTGKHGKACDNLTRKILTVALDAYDKGFEASGKLTVKT